MSDIQYITEAERAAIPEVAEEAARRFVETRLANEEASVFWTMKARTIFCTVRASKLTNAVWFNAITAGTIHNCVSSTPGKPKGVLVQSRYDATDFVGWIAEEIEEALIRHQIIRRHQASKHDNLMDMIVKKEERSKRPGMNPFEILGVSFERPFQ